jgi:hypothetical protein
VDIVGKNYNQVRTCVVPTSLAACKTQTLNSCRMTVALLRVDFPRLLYQAQSPKAECYGFSSDGNSYPRVEITAVTRLEARLAPLLPTSLPLAAIRPLAASPLLARSWILAKSWLLERFWLPNGADSGARSPSWFDHFLGPRTLSASWRHDQEQFGSETTKMGRDGHVRL